MCICVRIIQNILALVLFVNNVNEYEWGKKKRKEKGKTKRNNQFINKNCNKRGLDLWFNYNSIN